MKPSKSYVALAVLAGAALYFAVDLSASDRGPVDWIVIGALVGALLWNLTRLGRRLRAIGGRQAVWHEGRTVLFWILGLMNTVWARPGDVGRWKWWVGLALLVAAAADTVALARRERQGVAKQT